MFYPIAPSYRNRDLSALYRMHEAEKKRAYGERVREVERGVFTPLVFSSTGGLARECTIFFKRLADILAEKKKLPYSEVMYLVRCQGFEDLAQLKHLGMLHLTILRLGPVFRYGEVMENHLCDMTWHDQPKTLNHKHIASLHL